MSCLLPEPSKNQLNIINSLKNYNVVVDSVAGSGKTTTNLFIAKTYSEYNILLLTYNAKLKIETREKINELGITNMEVHSYHSFCVKYYDRKAYTDSKLITIINKNKKPINDFSYDIIILDEAQDITPLYYKLICKIYKYLKQNTENTKKICLLGDKYQSIYDFLEADPRFITHADQLFDFEEKNNWKKCYLSQSFRITDKMADFLNKCVLKYDRLISTKKSQYKPRYIVCDSFARKENAIYHEIYRYLDMGYSYKDIYILAPSVKSAASPVRVLANKLSNDGIPIFVPVSDDEKLDKDILDGKLVFSTYHQIKGLENKVVIVFNFDDAYFKFYKKNIKDTVCPNELYVATTRSLEQLTLVHHYKNDFLPFLSISNLNKYCDIILTKDFNISDFKDKDYKNVGVVELIRHLPSGIMKKCKDLLKIKNVKYINSKKLIKRKIDIPTKVEQKDGYENVSDITGIAIPTYLEYILKNNITIYKVLIDHLNNSNNPEDLKNYLNIKNIRELSSNDDISIDNLLFLANQWNAYSSGYNYKINQIENYDWLSKKQLKKCVKRLKRLNISKNAIFEKSVVSSEKDELLGKTLIGYIDCIDDNKIYEFKCVKKLKSKHYLQLACYMYLHKSNNRDSNLEKSKITKYYLYNILTNELKKVKCNFDKLKEIIECLIYNKYYKESDISDKEFLEDMDAIKEEIDEITS